MTRRRDVETVRKSVEDAFKRVVQRWSAIEVRPFHKTIANLVMSCPCRRTCCWVISSGVTAKYMAMAYQGP